MREMKDSGIEWIGKIPQSWETHRIKNNYKIISGNGFPPSIQGQETGAYPVCKASDISANNGKVLFTSLNYITKEQAVSFSVIPSGSVAFPKIGEAMKKNNRTILGVDSCLDNNCQALVPLGISSKYSLYLLSCIDMNWFDNAGTVPCVNNVKFSNSRIPFPDISEQRIIADFLDVKSAEIDSLSTGIKSEIDILEAYKRSVITEAVTKGLDKNVPMKDSGVPWIGEIPRHWLVEKVKYHLTRYEPRNPGNQQVLSVYREYGVIPKDSRDDNHNVTSEDTSKYKYVKPGNLVVNKMKAWQGSMGVSDYEGIVSPAYFIYHFTDALLIPKYLHYLFRTCYKDEFRRISGGIREGQWDLSPEAFANTPILIPPRDEQKDIINVINKKTAEIESIIAQKQEQLAVLADYKKSLIYEYVTGKKEVPLE